MEVLLKYWEILSGAVIVLVALLSLGYKAVINPKIYIIADKLDKEHSFPAKAGVELTTKVLRVEKDIAEIKADMKEGFKDTRDSVNDMRNTILNVLTEIKNKR